MTKVTIDLSEYEERLVNIVRMTKNEKSKSKAIKMIINYQAEHLEKLLKDYFQK